MKKLLISLFSTFLIVSMGLGQAAPKSSLLWEITGNDLKQPSYLFGTIHIICKEDFFLPPIVTEKFTNAEQVFLELDMDDPMMILKMTQQCNYTNIATQMCCTNGKEARCVLHTAFH